MIAGRRGPPPASAAVGRPWHPRHLTVLALLVGVVGCNGNRDNPVKRALAEQPSATEASPVVFRFPQRERQQATLYRLPRLDEVAWQFEAGPSPIGRVVGFAGDEDLVYTISTQDELIALDLTSGRARLVDTLVALATIGPTGIPYVVHADGSVAQIQRRSVVPLADTLPAIPEAIWGGVRGRLIALVGGEADRQLVTLTPGQQPIRRSVPGGPVAMATWGDIAAIATDSGIVTVNPVRDEPPRFVRLSAPAQLVALSPAAHHIYVVTVDNEILSMDRIGLKVLDRLSLAGPAGALRIDPHGRLMLVRPATGDSLWIVDVTTWSVAATVQGTWNENLPQVARDGTVLIRRGQGVVTFDVESLATVGEASDPRADRWLAAAWDPRRPDLELAGDDVPAPQPPGQLLYVQVSSTNNEAWATDLAINLRRAGMSATILPPDDTGEPYRVVLGPYPSREEAEQVRSRLQMPSWILTRDTTRSPVP